MISICCLSLKEPVAVDDVFDRDHVCINSSPPQRCWCLLLCWAAPVGWTLRHCFPALYRSLCTPDPFPPPARSRSPQSGEWTSQTKTHTHWNIPSKYSVSLRSTFSTLQKAHTLLLVAGWQSSRRTPKALGPAFLVFFIIFMPQGDFGGLLSSLASCFGERGGALLSCLLSRNVIRCTLGEESGLLPVGLQEGIKRKRITLNLEL